MSFEVLCEVDDIEVGTVRAAEMNGVDIAIARVGDREFYAVADRCTHGNVPLSEGDLAGCMVECWLHGSRFDMRTGEPDKLPATVPVAIYPVKVEGTDVLVDVTPTATTTANQES